MRRRLPLSARRLIRRARRRAAAVSGWALLALLIPPAIALGLLGGQLALGYGSHDRIVVGNTANTLSTLILVEETLVVFGAGNSRTDLADLIGRSTYPWNDRVHLLLIPAHRDDHAIGAIGLVERGGVEAVVVLGTPGADPIWTALERAAEREGTVLRFLTGTHSVELGPGTTLTFGSQMNGERASLGFAHLRHGAVHALIYDGSADATRQAVERALIPGQAHILVATTATTAPAIPATLVVRPRPRRAQEIMPIDARYHAELPLGGRLSLDLRPNEVRVPLARVSAVERD